MKKLILLTAMLLAYGCGGNVEMESDAAASYNDSVATCIYKNGNPAYGTSEYERVERMCDN